MGVGFAEQVTPRWGYGLAGQEYPALTGWAKLFHPYGALELAIILTKESSLRESSLRDRQYRLHSLRIKPYTVRT